MLDEEITMKTSGPAQDVEVNDTESLASSAPAVVDATPAMKPVTQDFI